MIFPHVGKRNLQTQLIHVTEEKYSCKRLLIKPIGRRVRLINSNTIYIHIIFIQWSTKKEKEYLIAFLMSFSFVRKVEINDIHINDIL